MLATSPSPYNSHHNGYLPPVSSPLRPRSVNIHGRHTTAFLMSPDEKPSTSSSSAQRPSTLPFSRRPVKRAPTPRQDELKAVRRGAFLRKVRDASDERRFAGRSDDIMRMDFVRRRRAWEEQQMRDAPSSDIFEDAEEMGNGTEDAFPSSAGSAMVISLPPSQQRRQEEEAEQVLRLEAAELEALVEYLPVQGEGEMHEDNTSEHLWSDDDIDYDELCAELAIMDSRQHEQHGHEGDGAASGDDGGEAMDIS